MYNDVSESYDNIPDFLHFTPCTNFNDMVYFVITLCDSVHIRIMLKRGCERL